jgi:Pin2-interacting protein X1
MSGEGRTSAIKATQKLDMLGIGMRQQSNVEGGIAWRQNRDFEDLLRRLNDGTTTETATATATTNSTELLLDSFHKARAREPEPEALEKVKDDRDDRHGDGEEEREGVMMAKKKKKKKKRKASAADEEEVEEREEGLDRKERKKRRKKSSSKDDGYDDGRAPVPSSIESEPPPRSRPSSREARSAKESGSVPMDTATATATATRPTTAVTAPVHVCAPYVACTFRGSENQRLMYSIYRLFHPLSSPRTHRARIIAAKRMAASNSTALAEILGIPSSSSSSSARPSAVASPLPDPALAFLATTAATKSTITTSNNATATTTSEAKDLLQNLTTSSQSVGDYFKAKLNAKTHGERQARPTSAAASRSTRDDHDDDDGRAGLGSGLGFGGGPSRIPPPPGGLNEEPVRGGIGASSLSTFATMFMPCQPTTNAPEENTATAGVDVVASHHDASDYDDNPKKSEKRLAKEERRRKKEERRRKRAEAEAEAGQEVDRVAVSDEDGARAARSKKKHREPETPDDRLEDPSGADGGDAIATKKRKKDKSIIVQYPLF